ncbi:MAG: hypothetical protein ACI35O_12195 [Bacillaceae bacterium]
MEPLKTRANRRLRQLTIVIFLLMLGMVVRVGYVTLFSEKDVGLEEREIVVSDNVSVNMEKHFNLDLQDYYKYDMDDLIKVSEMDESVLSLIGLVNQACFKQCIGQPITYIKFNHGYIFYKDSSEMNVVLEIKKNKEWEVINTQVKEDLLSS